ncbi:hypothetical protein TVAG_043770 [Trichomonas vaginalis G3]|uniref:Uncharacterized protein n=1 Tax=Trichomonas vaginalis (strain ATCC PRA-98 / G3) TaxID=412133 RepID=A2EVB7_TRIV3|nr:hypothetical protein TVAGG3_0826100 [Trichomonas vaginalis G3]EAY03431.1 hypothetical protein TVAG_043770 [Trichomonas vaginalis G3]KAI5498248.1 hypothetical protein TVAGG3_0826100 [Trichomonas vaginalis G3]|eukprot:XP_001315654.1 hypothetical protein [Trichomonas vaginalis G3]
MEVEISRGPKDYNMVSYSASGDLYNNDNDINSIPKTNIIAIGYYCNRSPTNTTYKITPIKSFYTYETYQYYDSRGIPLFFFNKIDIGNFEFNDSTIAYTSHHCDLTISQDLVFNVAKDTIIIFSRAANISATASVFGKTHSVLGKTKIKAIEYLSKGTLTLSTTSELGSCDFYTFNYSTEKCNFPIILSGEHKYYIKNLASGYKYCVFYAAAQRSVSYLVPKNLAYNRIEPDGTGADIKRSDNQSFFSPKLIVLHGDIFENKVYLAAYGSIYDDNYVIDGKNSKYSFYQISDYTFRKVNTNSKVGYTEVNNRLLIYIFVPFSIVTFIAVYLVYYFRRHRKNKDPELELLDQNNSNEAPQSNDQNDEGFTAPTYQLSTENNNLENPYY